MAEAAAEPEDYYHYSFNLTNPFLTDARIIRSFEISHSIISTKWKLELEPSEYEFRTQTILCTLTYDHSEGPTEVTADKIVIDFLLNGAYENYNRIIDYPFNEETEYQHSFEVMIDNFHRLITNIVRVRVGIVIKKDDIEAARAERNGEERPVMFGDPDRKTMYNFMFIMKVYQMHGRYCTMNMFPRRNIEDRPIDPMTVHHCLIKTRWSNFFRLHNLDENSTFVNTNISFDVLRYIINYVYTGDINCLETFWSHEPSVTELFQVIFNYEMFHLFYALRHYVLPMNQYTITYEDTRRLIVDLHFVRDVHWRRQSKSFPIFVYPLLFDYPWVDTHIFHFTVQMERTNDAGSWLSFSLASLSHLRFIVDVVMTMPRTGELIHRHSYNIPPRSRVDSGRLLFLPILIGHTDESHGLLFKLTFRNENPPDVSIWQTSEPVEALMDRRDVYTIHMREILRERFKTDMVVRTNGRFNGRIKESHRLHKVFFNSRIPNWYGINEANFPERLRHAVPDTLDLPLSSESYRLVVSYIYTGKMPCVPSILCHEIINFALLTDFYALAIVVCSMPSLERLI